MMMSKLPDDLLEDILCRVPATSLNRSRSTCKRWNRLFKNWTFTRKHFDKAAKQFLIHLWKESSVCSMSIDLHRRPLLEVTGEFSLMYPYYSYLGQVEIHKVSHCDGLLLCVCDTKAGYASLVVWNPCTGQTRWIEVQDGDYFDLYGLYALGSYQEKGSNNNNYKILKNRSYGYKQEFKIYEMNSDSWRNLDVTFEFQLVYTYFNAVSLKGKTYFCATDETDTFIISFDYTTERFERVCLPHQYTSYVCLSIVREEELAVFLRRGKITSKTEIWVSNKIGESKLVSWSMVLAVDLGPEFDNWTCGSFLVDEEKKVLVCCNNRVFNSKPICWNDNIRKTMVCIVGEDNKVKQVEFDVGLSWPFLFNYVPSLTQIWDATEIETND